MMEGSVSGARSVLVSNGSRRCGSVRPKKTWTLRIRIHNTGFNLTQSFSLFYVNILISARGFNFKNKLSLEKSWWSFAFSNEWRSHLEGAYSVLKHRFDGLGGEGRLERLPVAGEVMVAGWLHTRGSRHGLARGVGQVRGGHSSARHTAVHRRSSSFRNNGANNKIKTPKMCR